MPWRGLCLIRWRVVVEALHWPSGNFHIAGGEWLLVDRMDLSFVLGTVRIEVCFSEILAKTLIYRIKVWGKANHFKKKYLFLTLSGFEREADLLELSVISTRESSSA